MDQHITTPITEEVTKNFIPGIMYTSQGQSM